MLEKPLFICFDLSGAEFVVVGYEADDDLIKKTHAERGDHHTQTAHKLTGGVPLEVIRQEAKDLKHTTDPNEIAAYREKIDIPWAKFSCIPSNETLRQRGKRSNFGLSYRLGVGGFAELLDVDMKEAKEARDAYFQRAHPAIQRWQQRIKDHIQRSGKLVNCFGRTMPFHWCADTWGNFLVPVWNAACSAIPQSTVYDSTRIAMWRAYNASDPVFSRYRLAGQVHDEVYGVYPEIDPVAIADIVYRMAWDYMRPVLRSTTTGLEYQLYVSAKLGFNRGDLVEFDPDPSQAKVLDQVKEILEKLG